MIVLEHSHDGRVVTIKLNRPERRNALNHSLVVELTAVLKSLYVDDSLRVIVLTGSGNSFSAGADLNALQQLQNASLAENEADSRALAALFSTMLSGPKLLVAKVNGHAIAGGGGLVAACDLSFAASNVKFGFTEVRLGFVPAIVSTLLRFRINESNLRDILLSGRLFTAAEAVGFGLVNRQVSPEYLDAEVSDYVESICRNTSVQAIAQTKALLHRTWGVPMSLSLEEAIVCNAEARSTEDCRNGVQAFLNKSDAPWVEAYDRDHPSIA